MILQCALPSIFVVKTLIWSPNFQLCKSSVDKNDPPTLIFHGQEDYFVTINQSEILYNALKKAGATTKLVRVANAGHGYKPTPEGAAIKPSRTEMIAMEVQWFRKYLKQP
jgi:dipeptidyl aminopeptidase/acylaminoacyl peptidase